MERHCLIFSDLSVFDQVRSSLDPSFLFIHCTHLNSVHHCLRTELVGCVLFQISKRFWITPYQISHLKRNFSNVPFIAIIVDDHYEFIRFCGEIGIRHCIFIGDIGQSLKALIENALCQHWIPAAFITQYSIHENATPLACEAIQHLKQNYLKLQSVQELADYMGVTLYRLTKEVRKSCSLGPKRMLTLLKLQHAVHLMENQGYTLKEIAHLIGIQDPRRFNEIFHRFLGRSPSECRDEIKRHHSGPLVKELSGEIRGMQKSAITSRKSLLSKKIFL